MAKKRDRLTNPEPFNPAGNEDSKTTTSSRKRSKTPKLHQQSEQVLSSGLSSKILKEALIQQKEIEDEEAREVNRNFVFPEEPSKKKEEDDVDVDVDAFSGFSETRSHADGCEENDYIDDEDAKILDAFMSKDSIRQKTLGDVIVQRIKENGAQVSSEGQTMPKLDETIIELYKGLESFYGGGESVTKENFFMRFLTSIDNKCKSVFERLENWLIEKKKENDAEFELFKAEIELLDAEMCLKEAIEEVDKELEIMQKEEEKKAEMGLADEDDILTSEPTDKLEKSEAKEAIQM